MYCISRHLSNNRARDASCEYVDETVRSVLHFDDAEIRVKIGHTECL